jgi:hypothetical protein
VRLERLGRLKKKYISSGLEPATFRLLAQCLNQRRYRVPHLYGMVFKQRNGFNYTDEAIL